jgi:AcrR family transcriptional regulator
MANDDEPNGDTSWQQRAVDRSLSNARARAVSRSGQILDAARSLMLETDGIDFTVQDIVERSGLSLRSFYKHFGGKDELLLALFEDLLRTFAEDLRREVELHDDPLDQLRAYVTGFYGRAEVSGEHAGRALSAYHVRMLAIRKDEFAAALAPQIEVLREIIGLGVAAGAFRHDLDAEEIIALLTITLMSASQMAVLDVHLTGATLSLEHLWAWCEAAVAAPSSPSTPVERTSKAARGTAAARGTKSRPAKQAAKPPRARSAG